MLIWIGVYFPQLLKSYRSKSVEGVSVGWLILWILGDITNLSGAILVDGIPSQIVIATYYVIMDSVLIYQFQVYNHKKDAADEEVWSVVKFVGILLPTVLLGWILTGAGSSLGIMLGWSSACLYLSSRAPQLWKNYSSNSTGNLSMYLFLLAMLGNTTYGASVIAFSTDFAYLMKQAPWLLGSLGTLCLDATLLMQFYWYRTKEPSSKVDLNEAYASL